MTVCGVKGGRGLVRHERSSINFTYFTQALSADPNASWAHFFHASTQTAQRSSGDQIRLHYIPYGGGREGGREEGVGGGGNKYFIIPPLSFHLRLMSSSSVSPSHPGWFMVTVESIDTSFICSTTALMSRLDFPH